MTADRHRRLCSGLSASVIGGLLLLAMANPAVANGADILTLASGQQTRSLSLAQIETHPLVRARLTHPSGPDGLFSGIWIDDFLGQHGLAAATRVRFISSAGYSAFLTPKLRRDKRYLLVTRLNGRPIPSARLGPLLLIVPTDAKAVLDGSESAGRWISGIHRIEAQ